MPISKWFDLSINQWEKYKHLITTKSMAFQKNSFKKKTRNVHLILVLVVNSSFRLPCPRSRPFWNPGNIQLFTPYILMLVFFSCPVFNLLNTLHPNISVNIFFILFYTFSMELTRRICMTIKSIFKMVIISFILMTLICDSAGVL